MQNEGVGASAFLLPRAMKIQSCSSQDKEESDRANEQPKLMLAGRPGATRELSARA